MTFQVPAEKTLIETNGVYKYIGVAPCGSLVSSPVWQLIRLTLAGTEVTAIEWADGNQSYDNQWDERLSKAYS